AVEVGTAFSVAYPGHVTAIRFYKGSGNTGTHVGHLWNAQGDQLATVQFAGETAGGWQRAALSTPVSLVPGETYVVSYFAPNGGYSSTAGYFANPVTHGHIIAPAGDNGRYIYTASGAFPTQSWNSTAYFVDAEVSFGEVVSDPTPDPTPTPTPDPTPTPTPTPTPDPTPTPTPTPTPARDPTPIVTVTAVDPVASAADVAPTAVVTATFANSQPSAQIAVTGPGGAVAGASAYDSGTRTLTFTPTDPLAWSAT